MKKLTLLSVMMAVAFIASAMVQTRKHLPTMPQGNMINVDREQLMNRANVMRATTELITPPENALIETNWKLTGDYVNSGNEYTNINDIAVCIDGTDIYIQGLSYFCPDAWIKGTIDGETATFAHGQFVGAAEISGTTYDLFMCGTTDGQTLDDIKFNYTSGLLTLTNMLIENASTTVLNFIFYSDNLVLTRYTIAPSIVEVNESSTTAEVSWYEPNEATMWDLRYRKCDTSSGMFWDFEEEQGETTADIPAGWTAIDSDGDGYTWYHLNTEGNYSTHSGYGHMTSASYFGGVLTPDNWLVSPQVTLSGNLSFWACGQDASWASEVFAVYVTTGDANDIDGYTKLSDDITATGTMTEYTFDLSDYDGQSGHIAIRHYNVTDMFRLNVDDVTIGTPVEWTLIEGVTENPYTITGLDPNTDYEVQVRSVLNPTRAEGGNVSNWSDSALFTTLQETTGIETIKNDAQVVDNNYYNLMGQKMDGNNLPAGIYIHSGKKVVVK